MLLVQRGICFYRPPPKISMPVDNIPVFIGNKAILISRPANLPLFKKRHIGEYQRVRLVDTKVFDETREIVDMAFATGSIQPEFDQVTVISGQLL